MLLPFYQEDGFIVEAGLDEAGRGCLAGPVFASAVILPRDYRNENLDDSKKLSFKQREVLRLEIEKEALHFAVAEVSNQDIDRINILQASFLAMHRAVDMLSLKPGFLLVDGNRFLPYQNIPHVCIVKGDGKYLSIAAASVLAKTYRDDFMSAISQEYPRYGWKQNAGYPTAKHREAVEEYGFSPYHRRTFQVKGKNGLPLDLKELPFS